MLIRVSGKLTDNRPFSTRVEAPNLYAAIALGAESLQAADVQPKQITAKYMDGKSSISIGKVRAPKAKKGAKK